MLTRKQVMLNEVGFIVLDGVMIVTASLALTLVHPGFCFPQLSKRRRSDLALDVEKLHSDDSS